MIVALLSGVFVGDSPDGFAQGTDKGLVVSYGKRIDAVLRGTPGGLSVDKAVRSAVSQSPRIRGKESEVEAAEAGPGKTVARYLPKLNVSAAASRNNQVNFDLGGGMSEVPAFETPTVTYSLQANATLPLSDFLRLPTVLRAANRDSDAAELRRIAEVRAVATETHTAYYEWIRSLAQVEVADEAVQSVVARLEDAELGLQAGVTSQADVLQMRSAKASAKNTLAIATSGEAIARDALLMLMGKPVGNKLKVGTHALEKTTPDVGGRLREMTRRGGARRPELKALRAVYEATDATSSAARFDEFPKLAATGSVTHANPNQRFFPPRDEWNTSWVVGLNVSWSLEGYLAGRSTRKELQAMANVAKANLEQMELRVRSEIVATWQAILRSSAAIKNSKLDVKSAEAAYEQRVLEFRAGHATATEVLDAEVQRFQASLGQLNAKIDRRIAWAQLRLATGEAVFKGAKDK